MSWQLDPGRKLQRHHGDVFEGAAAQWTSVGRLTMGMRLRHRTRRPETSTRCRRRTLRGPANEPPGSATKTVAAQWESVARSRGPLYQFTARLLIAALVFVHLPAGDDFLVVVIP